MRQVYSIFLFFILFFTINSIVYSADVSKKKSSSFGRNIQLKIQFTGDFNNSFQVSGLTGQTLQSVAEVKSDEECMIKSHFQEIVILSQKNLALDLTLSCLNKSAKEQQHKKYQFHRLFINLPELLKKQAASEAYQIELSAISEKYQNLHLKITEFNMK